MRYIKIPLPLSMPNDPVPYPFSVFIEQCCLRAPQWEDEWADEWDEWAKDVVPALMAALVDSYHALQDHEHEKIATLVRSAQLKDPKAHAALMPFKHAVTRALREDPNKPAPEQKAESA